MADVLSLSALPIDFGEHFLPYKCSLRQRIQARRFANESYIQTVKLFRENGDEIGVKATAYHSQKKNDAPHKINLSLNTTTITEAHCTCKAGIAGECAHALALVLKLTDWILEGLNEVPSQPSCTEVPQQWGKPRGARIAAEPVSTMVLSKPDNTNRRKRPLTSVFTDNRKIRLTDDDFDLLQSLKGTPLGYLACQPFNTVNTDHGPQSVSSTLSHQLPLVQPMEEPSASGMPCGDIDFPHSPQIRNLAIVNDYSEQLKEVEITKEGATTLEKNTREQAGSESWHSERGKRLTASNFGRIMLRKVAINTKFIDSIMHPKKFTSASTSYGINNEKIARDMYRKKTKNHVHDCGLLVNSRFPCIGATPDGKVCSDGQSGILEIKCPFSIRDKKLSEVLTSAPRPDFFLKLNGENIELKRNHAYWFQVQGQLLVSGATFCDFVTYTRQDFHVIRVYPDQPTMEDILSKMLSVYSKFVNVDRN